MAYTHTFCVAKRRNQKKKSFKAETVNTLSRGCQNVTVLVILEGLQSHVSTL